MNITKEVKKKKASEKGVNPKKNGGRDFHFLSVNLFAETNTR